MVISAWWVIVVPYQNILITGSKALRTTLRKALRKALRITTERKYLSFFFSLRQAEKINQTKIIQNTLTVD